MGGDGSEASDDIVHEGSELRECQMSGCLRLVVTLETRRQPRPLSQVLIQAGLAAAGPGHLSGLRTSRWLARAVYSDS